MNPLDNDVIERLAAQMSSREEINEQNRIGLGGHVSDETQVAPVLMAGIQAELAMLDLAAKIDTHHAVLTPPNQEFDLAKFAAPEALTQLLPPPSPLGTIAVLTDQGWFHIKPRRDCRDCNGSGKVLVFNAKKQASQEPQEQINCGCVRQRARRQLFKPRPALPSAPPRAAEVVPANTIPTHLAARLAKLEANRERAAKNLADRLLPIEIVDRDLADARERLALEIAATAADARLALSDETARALVAMDAKRAEGQAICAKITARWQPDVAALDREITRLKRRMGK